MTESHSLNLHLLLLRNENEESKSRHRSFPFTMPPQHRVVVFVHNFHDIQADDFIPPRYFCGYDAEYAPAYTYRVSPKRD